MSLPPTMPPDPDEVRRRAAADPLFASAVRAAETAGVGDCLDVETLGLYSDRVLRGAALATAQAHIDRCERCRSIVAFVDQAAKAEVDAARAGGGVWAWLTGWRWLVPAASVAAVAVVAAWVNRGPASDAAAPPAAPQAFEASRAAGDTAAPPVEAPALKQELAGAAASEGASAATGRARPDDLRAAAPPAAGAGAPAGAVPIRPAGGASAPASGVPVLPEGSASAPASAARETAMAAVAARPHAEAAGAAAAAPAGEARTAQADRPSTANFQVPVPAAPAARVDEVVAARRADTRSPAWRVVDGAVERLRAGAWERVAAPEGVFVTAVASPSPDVCWAIGASAVLRTTDGTTWTRTALPETSEPLAAITATDASAATVTTASRARFRTTDGGATWTPL